MISVLILTKNEEADLPECLESVKWCDDVHVFDSFSDDHTIDVAQSYNATVSQRKFDGYSKQRNAALDLIKYKHPWVFILDADERIPPQLVEEMLSAVKLAEEHTNGFRIRRKDYLNFTWLKHAQISPYYVRLVRIGYARYHREINEVIEVEGNITQLQRHFDHFPFSKGFNHWLEKHNQYSTMEAIRWIEEHEGNLSFSWKKAFFGKDFSEKRYHQKGLFYKLPGRPLLKWLYMMFYRCAFLDGHAGMTYATLQGIYEYFIVIKTKDILRKRNRERTLIQRSL
jgi:glycosyltransferase involved in cell wall biosynthesis